MAIKCLDDEPNTPLRSFRYVLNLLISGSLVVNKFLNDLVCSTLVFSRLRCVIFLKLMLS
ncbi:hypothetical protein HanIR_Chr01g0015291 [Helianthus annuus]|nr:hypothetical protein HanIR_Chr01g0015291 [Helianthus annuus]